ncbi:hypothetical protein L198_00380 [Cryptococcus wingfieldii CBS 7118]|uniref:Nudix hydrolase domain-containing protein n=1 Tax=Cryptococcus wingfieldii CBS 7118 TaxID=1295528 RepID=A0A1E3K647_9TREE|nr:hypothetical protein L198_00380 [Cryptococcus wingfieldii CBS 7118]ODO08648.1 hypothetical protein L198_00380 [Cryptococcus wingfieldii CBS 7118]
MKSAFTHRHLQDISTRLIPISRTPPLSRLPPHTATYDRGRAPKESGVLIPLMNIKGCPHVLMQVRAHGMRVHAGEASFPGGKADPTDRDLMHTATRETEEELAIPPSHVQLLGGLEPEYSLGNKSRVWPLVGFVHSTPNPWPNDPNSSLPSQPISSLVPSPDEVSALLPLPLAILTDPARLSTHNFRLNWYKPYHKIRVEDLVIPPAPGASLDVEGLEVWGLSGWFLNKLCEKLGWLEPPEVEASPED